MNDDVRQARKALLGAFGASDAKATAALDRTRRVEQGQRRSHTRVNWTRTARRKASKAAKRARRQGRAA